MLNFIRDLDVQALRMDARIGQRLIIVAAAGGAFLVGILITQLGSGARELLILLFGSITLLAVLVPTDAILRLGLGIGIASIALGWRTIALSPDLVLAPFEIIIWALAAVLVVRSIVHHQRLRLDWSLPLTLFVFLMIPAFLNALAGGTSGGTVIGYGKNVLLVAPFFLVVRNLVTDLRTWRRLAWVIFGVCVYLAIVGLLVFFLPSQAEPLGTLLGADITEAVNYRRAGFPGWGPLAAWIFVLALGALLGFLNIARSWRTRWSYLALIGVLGLAVLVSGQRGAWLAFLVGGAVFAVFSPRQGIFVIAIGLLMLWLIPEENVWTRFASAFDPKLYDSSAADRYGRAAEALALLRSNPLGLGFGARTWVHSDYLEIGVAMGIPGLVALVGALSITGWRLLGIQLVPAGFAARRLGQGALAMFVILVVELASAGFVTLSFMSVIAWFFWAMADQYATIIQSSDSGQDAAPSDPPSHLQAIKPTQARD